MRVLECLGGEGELWIAQILAKADGGTSAREVDGGHGERRGLVREVYWREREQRASGGTLGEAFYGGAVVHHG